MLLHVKKNRPSVSLSARRAWIEITMNSDYYGRLCVALRKESVDRNCGCSARFRYWVLSLSARRAWIEMFNSCRAFLLTTVALRKESVDRNT